MDEFTCEPVAPGRLHETWPFIKRGLEAIVRKTPNIRWIPEDVYAALQHNNASAYLVRDNHSGRVMGFFVVHPQNTGFSDRTELFLWAAWTIPLRERMNGDNVDGAIRAAIEHMVKLAHDGGHVGLVFLTARRGFSIANRLGKPGLPYFTPAFTAYRVNIQ